MSFPKVVLRKARILVKKGAVSRISETVYSVESQHPERLRIQPHYMVEKTRNGRWVCSCEGFEKRGICSHAIAVMIIEGQMSQEELRS